MSQETPSKIRDQIRFQHRRHDLRPAEVADHPFFEPGRARIDDGEVVEGCDCCYAGGGGVGDDCEFAGGAEEAEGLVHYVVEELFGEAVPAGCDFGLELVEEAELIGDF